MHVVVAAVMYTVAEIAMTVASVVMETVAKIALIVAIFVAHYVPVFVGDRKLFSE